ncbi:GspH/FimT family pseudopilin [Marinobacter halotolerans]|uniref:GspH/FimT family pseudopilin n=1 Tax=Marinobacter halotolerans TaxID=1569211 RepID=UPI001245B6E8|nr:GspH/FimT family pseudopilin [Marinobacter halotolerans]
MSAQVFRNGFTLIELLVTIAILAITVTIAIPSFQNVIASNKLQEGRERLRTAIMYTKGEAVARNQTVTLCPSSDGSTCGDNNDWDENWLVVTDGNNTGAVSIATTLRSFEAPSAAGVTVTHTGGVDLIRFQSDGIAVGLSAAASFGFCDPDGKVNANSLILSPSTAALRTGTPAEANCP